MLSAAIALQSADRFGGYVSMAGTSRSILDIAVEQIRNAHLKKGDEPAGVVFRLCERDISNRFLSEAPAPKCMV